MSILYSLALALLLVLWLVCRFFARRWGRRRNERLAQAALDGPHFNTDEYKTQIIDSYDTTIITKEK